MELYLNDGNINVDDFVNKYLKEVSVELKNNPQFKENLRIIIGYLTNKKSSNDIIPPFQLVVSEDRRAFEIRSGIRSDPDCFNDKLKNNKRYNQVRFSLDDRNCMEVLYSIGVFYKYEDYAKNISEDITADDTRKSMFDISQSRYTPTVINVLHSNKVFLSNGIEIGSASYSDEYPLNCNFTDENELRKETMIHSPRKWYFNLMPARPPFEYNPSAVNVFRYSNQLGIVNVQTSVGKNRAVQNVCKCFATTDHPEKLGFLHEPIIIFKDGKEFIPSEVQQMYPGMDENALEREMNLSFYRGIEESETMRYNPAMAKKVETIVRESLINNYEVDEEELTSGKNK